MGKVVRAEGARHQSLGDQGPHEDRVHERHHDLPVDVRPCHHRSGLFRHLRPLQPRQHFRREHGLRIPHALQPAQGAHEPASHPASLLGKIVNCVKYTKVKIFFMV